MAHLDIRRYIAATPEAVWDVIADLEHQATWMVDVRRLEITTEQRSGVGTVLDVTSELFGLPVVKDMMSIAGWQPPYRMDVEHTGRFHGTGSFIVDRVENGSVLTWVEDFDAPFGPIGEAAFALVVRPHMLRVFARSLANVRRLAEERQRAIDAATPAT